MPSQTDEAARLLVLVQRLLDADLLTAAQAEALVDEAEAAGRFSEGGDVDSTRLHVEHIAQLTRALLNCGELDLADGQAVIQAANDTLSLQPDAGEAPR